MFTFFGNTISMAQMISGFLFVVLAPFVGGFLVGLSKTIMAKIQGCEVPSVMKPFADFRDYLKSEKEPAHKDQAFFVILAIVLMILAGGVLFGGCNVLMAVLIFMAAGVFISIAGYSSGDKKTKIAAERIVIQVMSYTPMLILTTVGLFLATGTFDAEIIVSKDPVAMRYLVGMLIGLLYVIAVNFNAKPYNKSLAFCGKSLAVFELAKWYELVFLLSFIYLLFANGSMKWGIIGAVICIVGYFISVLYCGFGKKSNVPLNIKSAWVTTLIIGGMNLMILYYLNNFALL